LKLSYSKSTPVNSFVIGGFWGLLVGMPYYLAYPPVFISMEAVVPIVLFMVLSNLTFYYCVSAGELSITSAILGTYPVFTVLFAVSMLGERLMAKQWLGILIIIVGVVILSSGCRSQNNIIKTSGIWILFSIISAILVGISDALSRVVVLATNVSTVNILLALSQIVAGLIIKLIIDRGKFDFESFRSKHSILAMFLFNVGGIVFTIALSCEQASVIVPLTSTYIALVSFFSWLLFQEKFDGRKISALTMIIIGILLM
jgi:uncharacterized membrane protein